MYNYSVFYYIYMLFNSLFLESVNCFALIFQFCIFGWKLLFWWQRVRKVPLFSIFLNWESLFCRGAWLKKQWFKSVGTCLITKSVKQKQIKLAHSFLMVFSNTKKWLKPMSYKLKHIMHTHDQKARVGTSVVSLYVELKWNYIFIF